MHFKMQQKIVVFFSSVMKFNLIAMPLGKIFGFRLFEINEQIRLTRCNFR